VLRRPVSLALHGVILAALVAGPLAYVAAKKSVRLDVDGVARNVSTYASSVGDLLVQQGISVGPRDRLSPAARTHLGDGMMVALDRARRVRLLVDGVERDVWTTAETVGGLTRQLGGGFQNGYLSLSGSTRIPLSGIALAVRLPKAVTVVWHGHRVPVVTSAATWSDALAVAGFVLGPLDVVSVPGTSPPVAGQVVVVIQVGSRVVVRQVAVPFGTRRVASAALYAGTTKVVTAGLPGRIVETWRYTLHNGHAVQAKLVSRVLATRPVTEVVAVGTKPRPAPPVPPTSVDSLNWPALAQCESGGNPRAVGGGGLYFGLYQFTVGAWHGVGGAGNPVDASSAEQTYRAKLLYLRSGAGEWPYCGHLLFT
jgi:resuscitation-promoting factor RpfB